MLLTEKPSPYVSRFGCSVQILNVLDYECLNRQETHRATPDPPYTLDDYSIDPMPAVDEYLLFLRSISPIKSDQFPASFSVTLTVNSKIPEAI